MRIFQILRAPNDTNGNPRRLTLEYCARNGNLVMVADHGYRGDCIPSSKAEWTIEDGFIILPSVNVSASEYADYRASARDCGVWNHS